MKKYLSIMFVAIVAMVAFSACQKRSIIEASFDYAKKIEKSLQSEYGKEVKVYEIEQEYTDSSTYCVLLCTVYANGLDRRMEVIGSSDKGKNRFVAYYLDEIPLFDEGLANMSAINQKHGVKMSRTKMEKFEADSRIAFKRFGSGFHKEINP